MKKVVSMRPSANFGVVVNGRVNRVIAVTWSANANSFLFVGQGQEFSGNMVLPDSYTAEQIPAFMAEVQKAVDEGRLKVYGYEFPVSVVSDGAAKSYRNPQHPDRQPMEVIRRAWPTANDDATLLALVKAQVNKSVAAGKLVPVV